MMNYSISNCVQGSHEWYIERSGLITGSTVGDLICKSTAKFKFSSKKVLGEKVTKTTRKIAANQYTAFPKYIKRFSKNIPPYELSDNLTSNNLLFDLRDEWEMGLPYEFISPSIETYAMREGKRLESIAAAYIQEKEGYKYETCGFVKSNNGLFGASPDLVEIDSIFTGAIIGGCEIKCPQLSAWKKYKRNMFTQSDLKKIEFGYYCQVQFLMYVCECSTWNFVFYFDSDLIDDFDRCRIIPIEKDVQMFELFEEIEKRFLNFLNGIDYYANS